MRCLITPVTCEECGQLIGLRARPPPTCPLCDVTLSAAMRAKMGTKWLMKVLSARREAKRETVENRVGVVYNAIKQLNYTIFYSQDGLVLREELLSVIRQLGLVVEQDRDYYVLTESPRFTYETAIARIPQFEGLRDAVRDIVEKELDEDKQFTENWPKNGTKPSYQQSSVLTALLNYWVTHQL